MDMNVPCGKRQTHDTPLCASLVRRHVGKVNGGDLIRDVAVVSDILFAAFLFYLGYSVMKVAVTGDRTLVTFIIPECDLSIMRSEFQQAETSILVREFIDAVKHVQNLQDTADRFGGEYISDEWRKIVTEDQLRITKKLTSSRHSAAIPRPATPPR